MQFLMRLLLILILTGTIVAQIKTYTDTDRDRQAKAAADNYAAKYVAEGSLSDEEFEAIRNRWREVADEKWVGMT